MKKYTFRMSDAYGDDYNLTVEAEDLKQAMSLARLADDDAMPKVLLKVEEA